MKALVLSGGAAHGAYQAGVVRALEDLGWSPDLVCGTSVGAINGAAVASGISGLELCQIWNSVSTDEVYRWRRPVEWFKFWRWNHLLDTSPLRGFLDQILDEGQLHKSPVDYVCFGVDVRKMRLVAFANRDADSLSKLQERYEVRTVGLESVLGSSAIPIVFPWISGIWDGAILQHTPLKPAVWMGADEIVVVNIDQPEASLPKGPVEAVVRLVNISTESRLQHDLKRIEDRNHLEGYRHVDVSVIRPSGSMGYSKLDFSSSAKLRAMYMAYEDTKQIMEK